MRAQLSELSNRSEAEQDLVAVMEEYLRRDYALRCRQRENGCRWCVV